MKAVAASAALLTSLAVDTASTPVFANLAACETSPKTGTAPKALRAARSHSPLIALPIAVPASIRLDAPIANAPGNTPTPVAAAPNPPTAPTADAVSAALNQSPTTSLFGTLFVVLNSFKFW